MNTIAVAVAADPARRGKLKCILGVGFGVAIVIGGTIGIGILRVPGPIAQLLQDPALIMAVWLAGGLYALLGANYIAELATMLPQAGGPYVYARRAYGDYGGFVVGWGDWIANTASLAYLPIAFGEYLVVLVPTLADHVTAIALLTILGFVLLHLIGLRAGSNAQKLTSVLKALGLLAFTVACFVYGEAHQVAPAARGAGAPTSGPALFIAALVAMQLVIETFAGWNSAAYFAEEDTDPGRNLPRSLIGGVVLIIGIYVLVNLAYLYVLPMAQLAGSTLPAADAMQRIFGGYGAQIVTVLALVSLLGIINAGFMNGPRILFALGRGGLFSTRAARVNAGGTPIVALGVSALAAIMLTVSGTFEQLFVLGAFFGVMVDVVLVLALFVLRRREPALARPFKAWGYPFAPLLMLLIASAIFIGFLISDFRGSLIAMAVIAASYPLYRLVKRRQGA